RPPPFLVERTDGFLGRERNRARLVLVDQVVVGRARAAANGVGDAGVGAEDAAVLAVVLVRASQRGHGAGQTSRRGDHVEVTLVLAGALAGDGRVGPSLGGLAGVGVVGAGLDRAGQQLVAEDPAAVERHAAGARGAVGGVRAGVERLRTGGDDREQAQVEAHAVVDAA